MIDAQRLREMMKTRELSQARLARLMEVTPPAIQQILNGKTKSSKLAPRLAKFFGVSQAWLEGESDSPWEKVEGSITVEDLIEKLKIKSNTAYLNDDKDSNNLISNRLFDPYWLAERVKQFNPDAYGANPSEVKSPDDDFFGPIVDTLRIVTDAMSPTIQKGDEVLVSLSTTTVDVSDGIWLFSYGNLHMIRRLMPLPDGSFRVSADNQASPTFEASAESIRVHGRAFWVGRPLI